jgi:hypothetical protein
MIIGASPRILHPSFTPRPHGKIGRCMRLRKMLGSIKLSSPKENAWIYKIKLSHDFSWAHIGEFVDLDLTEEDIV